MGEKKNFKSLFPFTLYSSHFDLSGEWDVSWRRLSYLRSSEKEREQQVTTDGEKQRPVH